MNSNLAESKSSPSFKASRRPFTASWWNVSFEELGSPSSEMDPAKEERRDRDCVGVAELKLEFRVEIDSLERLRCAVP